MGNRPGFLSPNHSHKSVEEYTWVYSWCGRGPFSQTSGSAGSAAGDDIFRMSREYVVVETLEFGTTLRCFSSSLFQILGSVSSAGSGRWYSWWFGLFLHE
jgi:hypothetical protein